tara:strand:+ start:1100 stop:2065 length:966 start_codon:yes stop_codon:yes gene_type:complete
LEKNVKILFISSQSQNSGSHRIWVKDLCNYFNKIGATAKIGTEQEIPHYDVIIYGKHQTPQKIKNKITGHINSVGWKKHNCDFIIVGSLEEKDSLSKNRNVFFFPLIEDMFLNQPIKIHKDTSLLKICYHGHETHLGSFEPHLKSALEDLSKEKNIELIIIHGNEKFNWSYGKPNVKTIYKKWNINTISDDIKACDIGVCPNAIEPLKRPHRIDNNKGLFDSDYTLRFKNKSNAGRAFVFHQLGIPVIADLTPSYLHILGNPDNGYCVISKEGWLSALRELSIPEHRNFISQNARKEFDRLYDPIDWVKKLYKNIKNIYHK